jgi:hypothetical protein
MEVPFVRQHSQRIVPGLALVTHNLFEWLIVLAGAY